MGKLEHGIFLNLEEPDKPEELGKRGDRAGAGRTQGNLAARSATGPSGRTVRGRDAIGVRKGRAVWRPVMPRMGRA